MLVPVFPGVASQGLEILLMPGECEISGTSTVSCIVEFAIRDCDHSSCVHVTGKFTKDKSHLYVCRLSYQLNMPSYVWWCHGHEPNVPPPKKNPYVLRSLKTSYFVKFVLNTSLCILGANNVCSNFLHERKCIAVCCIPKQTIFGNVLVAIWPITWTSSFIQSTVFVLFSKLCEINSDQFKLKDGISNISDLINHKGYKGGVEAGSNTPKSVHPPPPIFLFVSSSPDFWKISTNGRKGPLMVVVLFYFPFKRVFPSRAH